MTRSADTAGGQRPPAQEPVAPRLGAFATVLVMYLLFTALLMLLGYQLWPALAAATAACVVAGEVARRVITAGTPPPLSTPGAMSIAGSRLPGVLRDITPMLDRRGGLPPGGQDES